LLSPVVDIDSAFSEVSESFEAFHDESRPGFRLKDLFPSQLSYSLAPWPKDEDGLEGALRGINKLRSQAMSSPGTFVVTGDGSASGDKQAVAAAIVESAGVRRWEARMVLGKASSQCAELLALAMGVQRASRSPGCRRILVFTDSSAAANLLLDADPHSGQSHSIATCRLLREWLSSDPAHTISFHFVSSKAKWDPHHQAHLSARSLKVPFGVHPKATLEWYRTQAIRSMIDSWTTRFADLDYRGNHFLPLYEDIHRKRPLQPTHVKRGPWLKYLWMEGADNPLVARFCCAVLNHAPIGAFRAWLNVTEDPSCSCGETTVESREHILFYCRKYQDRARPLLNVQSFIKFLIKNPLAFAFTTAPGQ
jgi:hypothetical protein